MAGPSSWLLAALALVACGPVAIGVGVASLGGGGGGAAEPLTIEAVAETAPAARAGSCNLVALLRLKVSRPNAILTYSLNGRGFTSFTVPETGVVEPELRPGVPEERFVLLRAGSNTLVVKASVGGEEVSQTLTLDRAVDPVIADIEPVNVRGRSMTVSWSLPAGASPTFFWIYFDDALAADLDGLQGTAGNGGSPLRVPVSQLSPVVVGGRVRYSFELTQLANAANEFLQYHFIGVRANDGCESRIVAAHTRPRAQVVTWPANMAAITELAPVNGVVAQAPVGGLASSVDVVGMPPILVDRGADATNQTTGGQNTISEADGLPDLVLTDRDGKTFVGRNGFGIFDQPVAVDDVVTPSPPCGGLANGPAGQLIRSFSFDNDGDDRPDLFVLSGQRLTVYAGDPAAETNTSFPTPDELRFLNFKKYCTFSTGIASIQLSNVPSLPSGAQFLDAFHGDFDGDGFQDLVASVGQPQTSSVNGSVAGIYIWFASAGNGFTNWDWPSTPPLVVPVGSAYGDDGYFLVGDIDADGRDDLLTMRHESADSARYRAVLLRGRTVPPVQADIAVVDPRNQTARWDQLDLVDFDYDGVLDVVGLRTAPFAASSLVQFVGYRTDLATPPGPSASLSTPQIAFSMLSTHGTTFPAPPRQRGHFQLVDIEGDGIRDILVRSIRSATDYSASVVARYSGRRDPVTGRQDWFGFNTTVNAVQLPLASGDVPHVHFAANDLNYDGAPEFSVVHQRPAPPHALVTMQSEVSWKYSRYSEPPAASDFLPGGTMATGVAASIVDIATVVRAGDAVLGVDASLGVRVATANLDEGRGNGSFAEARWIPIQPALPSPVRAISLPDDVAAPAEIGVLCENGATVALRYDAAGDRFLPVFGSTIANPVHFATARFDTDQRTDAVVIDAANVMHLLTTVSSSENRNGPLSVRDSVALPAAVEMLLATQLVDESLAEVAVILAPSSGSSQRELRVYRVLRDTATGVAAFAAPQWVTQFQGRVVSLAAANLNGRYRNNIEKRKWLIAGMEDGRVMAARNGQPAPQFLPGIPQFSGPVDVLAADLNNDNLPDVAVQLRGSRQLSIFRNQPDQQQPFRFPNPDGYQFQGSGSFDGPAVITLPGSIKAMTASRLDNDVYNDLITLSSDGQRVHLVLTRGQQLLQ